MKKRIICLILLGTIVFSLIASTATAFAATENDLRDVMGIGRISKEKIKKQTNILVERLAREEEYNDLVKFLRANQFNASIQKSEIANAKASYNKMIDVFQTNPNTSDVINALVTYNSHLLTEDDEYDAGDKDYPLKSTKVLKEKITALRTLQSIEQSNIDVGMVGKDVPNITQKDMKVTNINSQYTSFRTKPKKRIYNLLTGSILKKTRNSVTVQAGRTIYITYKGVSCYKPIGTKVKQGTALGKATGANIKVALEENTKDYDILLIYGKRGKSYFDDYASENPWQEYFIDFSNTKEHPTKQKVKEKVPQSYLDDHGIRRTVKIETPKKSHKDIIYNSDPFETLGEK